MNCRDCRDRLDRFLDRELSDNDVSLVKLHMGGCPDCADQYQFQNHLKRLVKVSCEQDSVPPAFREKLRKILS